MFSSVHCCHIEILDKTLRGEILGLQIQNTCKYYYWLLFYLSSYHSCCNPSTIVVSPQVWSASCYECYETLGTCCSQTLSTVLMTLKSNRKRVDFYSQCEILGLYVLRSRLHACVCVVVVDSWIDMD